MIVSSKEITQISIYLKVDAEKVNEVALMQPLMHKAQFNEKSQPIVARRWRFTSDISFMNRVLLKGQSFLLRNLPMLIPHARLTPEAKFKTVVAMLLAQEGLREFFLSNPQKQHTFYQALASAASACGYHGFAPPSFAVSTPLQISRNLTLVVGKRLSLIDDLMELNLQIACLNYQERNEILYCILNQVERPPIHSVIEVTDQDTTHSICLTTRYAKYKIQKYDTQAHTIQYTCVANQATSSIRVLKNSLPDTQGTMNQRTVFDADTKAWIGSYCGELSTSFHVLEQLLLIMGQSTEELHIVTQPPDGIGIKDIKVLFTSLYSWSEIALITDQQAAIRKWDQKIFKCGQNYFRFYLAYYNIQFNALNHYPVPAELKATMQDINDEAMIILLADAWRHLGLHSEELTAIASRIGSLQLLSDHAFLERKQLLNDEIDLYRQLKPHLSDQMSSLAPTSFIFTIQTLLSDKTPDGKTLKGIDKLLYLDYAAKQLGYLHNKNCQNATDRTAGADAADKAQHAFQVLYKQPFMPCHAQENEKALFKVLYSLYLVWEEPEINTALSTGFLGEKFYNNFIQKNPETTRYLMHWLKKHPEMYLGLSDYRT